ncbi:MAG: NAD-dependent epimerase/dehydratase family protein [Acidimicrobiales bacterium]
MMRRFDRVMVTGGAGYVGNVLTPALLDDGYEVTVYDLCLFDKETLPLDHPRLTLVEADIRDTERFREAVAGHDAVLHLACISNDPSFELDEDLSKTINFDCFEPLVVTAKEAGVRRFVYCSSSSVYGVSDQPDVTEEHPLVPLTLYNKFKGLCEPILFSHRSPGFECVTLRPATVCGYSPRCRLDLSVNILTNHAVNRRHIDVFGGDQLRPNLHIDDMADAYRSFLEAPGGLVDGEVFNVGYENLTIRGIAELVKTVVEQELPAGGPIEIAQVESDDLRSYHINSGKIRRVLGFEPKRSVEDAVRSLCRAFADGRLPTSLDDDRYFNVRTMKARAIR